jgi:hypothetical protein
VIHYLNPETMNPDIRLDGNLTAFITGRRHRGMSRLLDRLLMWIAGVIDRNLLTVPDLDDDWPRSATN